MKSSILNKIITVLFLALSLNDVEGQISVQGPNCVVTGVQYTYNISGTFSVLVERRWCASNGIIVSVNRSCDTAIGYTSVKVIWNGPGSGYIYCGSSEGSSGFSIQIASSLSPGTITTGAQVIPYNTIPATISCTAASGGVCGSGHSYQWQQSVDASNWTDISEQTSQHLSFSTGLTQTTYFRRKVTATSTNAVGYSDVAAVHVTQPLSAGSIGPLSQSIPAGSTPGIINGSVASNGNCGSYSYQWQQSTNGSSFSDISGATGTSYSPPALTQTTWYKRRVTCSSETAYTETAVVNVYPVFTAGVINQADVTITHNTSPGTLTATVPTGGNCSGNYTYQWQESVDNVSYTDISGMGTLSFNPGNLTATRWYRLKQGCGLSILYTNAVNVTVSPQLAVGQTSVGQSTIPHNTTPGTIVNTGASGGNCSGNYDYQWQYSSDNINFADISNAGSVSYYPGNLTNTGYYRLKVTCGSESVYSNTITITVLPPPIFTGTIVPGNMTIGTNSSPGIITGNPSHGGSCNGNYSYQWQQSTDGVGFTDIVGATSQNYTPGNLTATTWFRRQVICGTDTGWTNASQVVVGTATCADWNYVLAKEILKPGVTDPSAVNSLSSVTDVRQTTQFFDGLGRLIQTVSKQASRNPRSGVNTDLVSINVYDALGREQIAYLPYVSTESNGNLKCNPLIEQRSFNALLYPDEQFSYAQKEFDGSPLNQVAITYAQGNSWVGNNRGLANAYLFNTERDSVRIWTTTDNPNTFGSYVASGSYSTGELYKTISVDEHGKQVIEFKDKTGNLILKKVQLTAPVDDGAGAGYAGWLCTYHMYDDHKNLRCVVQPKGVELLLENGWDITAKNDSILNEQCFRYEYDHRNRMILKKVPGAGMVVMIYDARDRLVMTQDANMRQAAEKKWLVTVYDNWNRPSGTYLITDAVNYNNAAFHRVRADTSVSYPDPANYTNELLTETHYDNYTGIPSGFSVASLSASGYGPYLDAASSEYPESLTLSPAIKDLTTWTRAKVLGENNYIVTCNLYDKKGRLIQVQTKNYTGAFDAVTNQYSFSGKLLRTHTKHEKAGSAPQNYELATRNIYDDLYRLVAVECNINGVEWKRLVEQTYDVLGKLKKQTLAPYFADNNGLDSISYDYNIRGWTLGANREYAISTTSTDHYFGFDLGYDKTAIGSLGTYAGTLYNGNIAGTVWKSKGDGDIRKYDFSYDAVNRLTGADFNQYSSGFNKTANVDFSVSGITYDANGNIMSQIQKGVKPGSSVVIDDLKYNYHSNSNKLLNIIDAANDTSTNLGDFRASKNYVDNLGAPKTDLTKDYNYDLNGSLVQDKNKDITDIAYNHLNLPKTITVANKGSIDFVYDALGNKLKKVVHETGKPDKVTLYLIGNYENDSLRFLPQGEGRIRPVRDGNGLVTSFAYDYFLKDHLGNVRMVLTDESRQDIYPAATLEGDITNSSDAIFIEKDYFNIPTTGITYNDPFPIYQNNNGIPNNNPNSITTNDSRKVLGLQASSTDGGQAQLGIAIKVMSGDHVDVFATSYCRFLNNSQQNYGVPVLNILSGLLGSPTGVTAGKGVTAAGLNGVTEIYNAVNSFLNDPARGSGGTYAKAYVNWILFDDNFRFVKGGFSRVPIAFYQAKQHHNDAAMQNIEITKNGYLYAYVSNQSPVKVYFDNLQLVHTRGPVLEETHYYPFGLTMAGISAKATKPDYAENKYRFNKGSELQSKEFSDGSGLEWYATNLRMYDPQIGRWHVLDPKPDPFESLYAGMKNNPVRYNDPLGDTVRIQGFTEKEIVGFLTKGLKVNAGQNPFFFQGGRLKWSSAKYNKLSKEQKAIADNIIGDIKSDKNHIIIKADNETVYEKGGKAIHKSKVYGDIEVPQPDQKVGDVAGLTVPSKDGKTISHYVNVEYFEKHTTPSKDGAVDKAGNALPQYSWLTMFHEVGGHGYYKYNQGDLHQGGRTIDYENIIRTLHGLTPRAYDNANHKEPPKEE